MRPKFDLVKGPEMTKAKLVEEIAKALGVPVPRMSTGSTELRVVFEKIDKVLGLSLKSTTKHGMAREIVESVGNTWHSSYVSRGATVTKDGLRAVLVAVKMRAR